MNKVFDQKKGTTDLVKNLGASSQTWNEPNINDYALADSTLNCATNGKNLNHNMFVTLFKSEWVVFRVFHDITCIEMHIYATSRRQSDNNGRAVDKITSKHSHMLLLVDQL